MVLSTPALAFMLTTVMPCTCTWLGQRVIGVCNLHNLGVGGSSIICFPGAGGLVDHDTGVETQPVLSPEAIMERPLADRVSTNIYFADDLNLRA